MRLCWRTLHPWWRRGVQHMPRLPARRAFVQRNVSWCYAIGYRPHAEPSFRVYAMCLGVTLVVTAPARRVCPAAPGGRMCKTTRQCSQATPSTPNLSGQIQNEMGLLLWITSLAWLPPCPLRVVRQRTAKPTRLALANDEVPCIVRYVSQDDVVRYDQHYASVGDSTL